MIGRDPSLWYQTIEVDAGSGDGVAVNDPVTGDGGLVGKVTEVTGSSSIVTLITNASSNEQFGVTASVTNTTGDTGVLEPAVGNPNQMVLQDLPNRAQITPGMQVVTAGFKDPANRAAGLAVPAGDPDRHGRRASTPTSCSTAARCRSRRPPTSAASRRSRSCTKVGSGTERAQVTP